VSQDLPNDEGLSPDSNNFKADLQFLYVIANLEISLLRV
jgi:hypothetical protein